MFPNYSLDTYYAKIIPSIIYQGLVPNCKKAAYYSKKFSGILFWHTGLYSFSLETRPILIGLDSRLILMLERLLADFPSGLQKTWSTLVTTRCYPSLYPSLSCMISNGSLLRQQQKNLCSVHQHDRPMLKSPYLISPPT